MILHRLHLTGRAARVLVVVPEPLVHQGFVEALRRFNLLFSISTRNVCEAISGGSRDQPVSRQSTGALRHAMLADSPELAAHAVAADWESLIVDEAITSRGRRGRLSRVRNVDALAKRTPGLLLLTATPQQLGQEGHFARLRLLDPERYTDLASFVEEGEHYEQVARSLDRLLGGEARG